MKPGPGFAIRFAFFATLLAAASGCASQASPTPSLTPVVETVVVVVTATEPTSTLKGAEATPTPPEASPTPTLTPTQATPTPNPSPTGIVLVNVPIDGGDPNNKFFALLVYPSYNPAATTSLVFRVYAHKPSSSTVDGEGIDTVDFSFLTSTGDEVYSRQEKQAGYCAFQGGEPDCNIWVFAEHNNEWPNGNKIVSDTYTLSIVVTAKDQSQMNGKIKFRIQLP